MHLFFQSLVRHFSWWMASLCPGRHEGAPLNGRRLLFLLFFYPAYLVIQFVHWLGFLCDELFFPSYRKVEVTAPVFIIGIPRSGTTFLHRELARDEGHFSSFSTWEALLAPSITERKISYLIKSIDRKLGAPLKKSVAKLIQSSSVDFDDIHEVSINAPEEDYLSLLPAGACFLLLLAFPFAPYLKQLGHLNKMPKGKSDRLLAFYKRALQRHLYCHPGKRLLSKNAAFATWGEALKATFPDAKFLVCIREPTSALSSQLSSLSPARAFFGTDTDGSYTAETFTEMYQHFYETLYAFIQRSRLDESAVLDQADLKNAPVATIIEALEQVGIERSPGMENTLIKLRPGQPSAHHHKPSDFALDTRAVEACIRPHYEALLHSPNRTQIKQ